MISHFLSVLLFQVGWMRCWDQIGSDKIARFFAHYFVKGLHMLMKRNIKLWWSTFQPISSKLIIISHLKLLKKRPRRIPIEIQIILAWDRKTKRVWNEPIFRFICLNYQYSAYLVKIGLGGVIGSVELIIGGDRDRRGRDHMVVGFTTTCAINAYHH